VTHLSEAELREQEFTRYILWFIYSCIIYAIVGFSWGALMGGVPSFRQFVNFTPHGHLIVLAHAHINLLGWVEMAIFGALYYVVPKIAKRPIYSVRLVKIHFWMHTVGLIGLVVFFFIAGVLGGTSTADDVEKQISHLLAWVGVFGTLVLLANIIWGYNLFRTSMGWDKR
jgi:cytochrome c oxidase cbb3-type subunit 1